jgi:hypothetical protein
MPSAIATRTFAESIARLSYTDVATSAVKSPRIVAGSKPRPRAVAVAVSDVFGSFAITTFALNSRATAARL